MNEDAQIWADKLLASINMPASAPAREMVISSGTDAGLHLDSLVTDEVVDTMWGMWNTDQSDRIKDTKFRKAFKHMLSEGVRLGFRLNRFRDVASSLPDPGDETAWAAIFEDVIAGRDRCKVRLYLSPSQYHAYLRSKQMNENADKSWDAMLTMMRDGLFYELGIIYPPFDVMDDESLQDEYIRIEWNDLQLPPRKGIGDDQVLVNDTVDRLTLLNVHGETAVNPANGSECALINTADVEVCENAGLTTWDSRGYTILSISSVLRRAARAFINRYLVWYFLNAINQVWPTLVSEVKERINLDLLVQILRGLIDEEISVRDLKTILESILSARSRIYADASKYILFAHNASGVVLDRTAVKHRVTVTDYVNLVRVASKRYISYKYTRGQNTLIVYLLDPAIERRLRRAQSLSPLEHKELLDAVRYEVGSLPPTAQNPVILTTHEIRLRMRTEIRHEFPHLAVLSYQELSPDMNIQPIARISTDDWLDNRSEQWSRHYALRIEESYSLLLKAFAARSGSGAAISYQPLDWSPWEGFAEADYLQDRRADIVKRISNRIGKERPEVSDTALQDFVQRYLEGYLNLLVAGRTNVLDELMTELSPALAKAGTRCSDVYGMSLMIYTVIRELLAEKYVDPDDKEAMARFNRSLDQTEAIAHQAARIALDACFKSKLERLIQCTLNYSSL